MSADPATRAAEAARARRRAGPVGLAATGLAVAAALVPVAVGVGALVRGGAGAAGGAIGGGIAVVVVALTLVTAVAGERLGPQAFAAVLMGGFLAKLVVVLGLLAAAGTVEGPHRTTLGLTVVVGLVVALAVEAMVSLRARVPYVDAPGDVPIRGADA